MHVSLQEEQALLQASAARFFQERHPPARARLALPWSDERQALLWNDMGELGWLGVMAPAQLGGLELGLQDACLVAQAAGRALLNLPYVPSAVLLPLLLREGHGSTGWLAERVGGICAGREALAVAPSPRSPREHAGQCTQSLVLRIGESLDAALGLVPPCDGAPSLDCTLRVSRADAADVQTWQALNLPHDSLMRCLAGWRLARSAEMLGAAQASFDMACDYARDRQQFGKAIGSYQAIKHRLADGWMLQDDAQLALRHACAAFDLREDAWEQACEMAVTLCTRASLQLTHDAIQVHGALGFTWEHDAHLFLKRVRHHAAMLGPRSQPVAEACAGV